MVRAAKGPHSPIGIFAMALSLFLVSCSFDYGNAQSAQKEEEPNAIFVGFVHRIVDKGVVILEIRADRAESYAKSHKTELEGVAFTQYDGKGVLAASGTAKTATVWTDTNNAEFRGDVSLVSKSEKAVLTAETLTWTDSTKVLTGGLERVVSVRRDDGAWVTGAGFRADLKRRAFSFQQSTEGKIVPATEAPAESQATGNSPK